MLSSSDDDMLVEGWPSTRSTASLTSYVHSSLTLSGGYAQRVTPPLQGTTYPAPGCYCGSVCGPVG